uniref:Uncharacterized protein n=1 Tax=Cucumis melo TaxID=3656 RepID=A0A9I9E3A2_CUCME
RRGTAFYPRTRKLSPGHSRSRFLGTSTGSPRAQPVSFAASAFPVVSDTGRAFATRWKLRPSFGPFWVAPQFSRPIPQDEKTEWKTCQGACQECGLKSS